jgi:two-component system sensor histidine kinase RegB
VSLLLLPVIVSAALLRRPIYIGSIATMSAAGYTALMFIHVHPLFIHVHPSYWADTGPSFTMHIQGMWSGFLLSASIVAYFIAKMGCTLRARDHELALAREKGLQANQLIALGSPAAKTAHELGTPLATMVVLTKKLEHEYRTSPERTRPLCHLRNQINRCKEILSRMAARAGQTQAEAVALRAHWTSVQLQIEITDCGRGLPAFSLLAAEPA